MAAANLLRGRPSSAAFHHFFYRRSSVRPIFRPAAVGDRRANSSPRNVHVVRASSSSSPARSSASEDVVTVRLVSINDVYDLTNLPRLATFIRSLDPRPSATTLNGDFLSPSALSSIDDGRGHVAALRASGVTHVSLGNHEADLKLPALKDRLDELRQRGRIVVLNSNVSGMGRHSRELDIVSSACGRIRVGLMGLLSDENGMFRDNTFRGLKIGDCKRKYATLTEKVDMMRSCHCLVPMTHQSLDGDVSLAKWMAQLQSSVEGGQPAGGVILGGHEHVKIHEITVNNVHIVKSGYNCERAAVVDLEFNPTNCTLENVNVRFEELDERHESCPVVKSIVGKHLTALEQMQDFTVFDNSTMLSAYFIDLSSEKTLPLSSQLTRYEQTTVGAFFCTAVKSELGADVCIINGAPIKASKVYADGTMSYDDLRNELPFPLKMIVVEMTRKQLREAIEYSRTNVEEGKSAVELEDGRIERRGYLQTDFDYWMQNQEASDLNEDDILTVALPRNLLKGFCKIQPLMDLRHELDARNALPDDDDHMKAIDLIVRYCCKGRWATIGKQFTFDELDQNNDGIVCREEIRMAIKRIMGEEPSDALVDGMVGAVDDDASGLIDENEFNKMLDTLRSQSQL